MKTKLFIVLAVLFLTISSVSAALSDDRYTFELSEIYSFSEKTPNWHIEISVPQLSGMADEATQAELNAHFFAKKDEMMAEYKELTESAAQSIAEGNDPHFWYQYLWEVVTDSEDHFVFRTSWFFGAGSSTTLNEYWNLDKKTGKLLVFSKDVVASPEQMAAIREQIYTRMLSVNESGMGVFWTEGGKLDAQLGQVGHRNHWYYNADDDLVITFDKFDIAPGIMGSPEFVIKDENEGAEARG